ncbi:hypothetical protein P154DRAFT_248894 [Amniculicola lignicola CBS 123094]|uniref:Uncharacterized protein n=1 Tax=Amniculicola lignicola CBS 123094 TaxID=1392246 RepID=A0A6A5WHA5_9PLEO|nr:hypothetical protein P154DRAFT_248894 [Amniculicola lignicola CBS 123094]
MQPGPIAGHLCNRPTRTRTYGPPIRTPSPPAGLAVVLPPITQPASAETGHRQSDPHPQLSLVSGSKLRATYPPHNHVARVTASYPAALPTHMTSIQRAAADRQNQRLVMTAKHAWSAGRGLAATLPATFVMKIFRHFGRSGVGVAWRTSHLFNWSISIFEAPRGPSLRDAANSRCLPIHALCAISRTE